MRLETSGGVSLQLHAGESIASAAAAARAGDQVFDLLSRGLPIAVRIDGLRGAGDAETDFAAVCTLLHRAATNAGANPASISIVLDAAVLAPQLIWMHRTKLLGTGPTYLLVDAVLIRPAADAEARRRQDQFWLQCFHLRNADVRTAFAPTISSACPLLPPESALGILPPLGLQVPTGTAWIPLELDLTRFADQCGELDLFELQGCLQRCIEVGESMHDDVAWPTAAMQHDAWLNRRLAISLTGIGDLAERRGADPTCFNALQGLISDLRAVRDMVNASSRKIAAQTEPAPSLALKDLCRGTDWELRWSRALEFAAVRHRNLLAMSPWSLFPSTGKADSRYVDLVPLLEFADVCAFPPPPCLQGWNVNEFKNFHRRAWAVLERKEARALIAEQV